METPGTALKPTVSGSVPIEMLGVNWARGCAYLVPVIKSLTPSTHTVSPLLVQSPKAPNQTYRIFTVDGLARFNG